MCTTFDIIVEGLINPVDPPEKLPEFKLDAVDQRVKVGQSLVYSPTVTLNTHTAPMTREMDLGQAFSFASFDKSSGSLVVNKSKVEKEHIGKYMIIVKTTF